MPMLSPPLAAIRFSCTLPWNALFLSCPSLVHLLNLGENVSRMRRDSWARTSSGGRGKVQDTDAALQVNIIDLEKFLTKGQVREHDDTFSLRHTPPGTRAYMCAHTFPFTYTRAHRIVVPNQSHTLKPRLQTQNRTPYIPDHGPKAMDLKQWTVDHRPYIKDHGPKIIRCSRIVQMAQKPRQRRAPKDPKSTSLPRF